MTSAWLKRWLLSGIAAGPCNVRDYGAVGDGLTDDTAAILGAIADAGVERSVYLPAGIYLVGQIDVAHSLTMHGDGPERSILKAAPGIERLVNAGGADVTVQLHFSGFSLEGNALTSTALYLGDRVIRSTFRDLHISGCLTGTGIANEYRNYSLAFERCEVTGNMIGARFRKRCQDLKITNCQFYGNTVSQIDIGDGSEAVGHVSIIATQLERTSNTQSDAVGLRANGATMLMLLASYLETKATPGSASILVESSAHPTNLLLSGNTFNGNGAVAHAIILPADASRVTLDLAGNLFSGYLADPPILNLEAPQKVVTRAVTREGTVGIGVLQPQAPLHVRGRARFDEHVEIKGRITLGQTAGGVLNAPPGQSLTLNYQSGRDSVIWDGKAGQGREIARFHPERGLRLGGAERDYLKGMAAIPYTARPGPMPPGATLDYALPFAGAQAGDAVQVSACGLPLAGLLWSAAVESDLVIIRLANVSGATLDPGAVELVLLWLDLT